jgi:hypothetical protein
MESFIRLQSTGETGHLRIGTQGPEGAFGP